MLTRVAKITRGHLECMLASTRHAVSDHGVLQKYLPDVREDRLEPDALLFYISLIEPCDIQYLPPALDALERLLSREPVFRSQLRLRGDRTLDDLEYQKGKIQEGVGALLKALSIDLPRQKPPVIEANERLTALLQKLDELPQSSN